MGVKKALFAHYLQYSVKVKLNVCFLFNYIQKIELTRSCTMKNCSFDGGHSTHFVERWKAQLLLNTLCEVR